MLRFWKWKWIWRSVFALLILVPCGLLALRAIHRGGGASLLREHTDKLDRDDPGWRLADIEAKYNAELPPDDENAMVVATAVLNKLGRTYGSQSGLFKSPENHPTNALLREKDVLALKKLLQPYTKEAAEAKAIAKATKNGGVLIRFPSIPIAILMPEVQNAREVAGFLRFQSALAMETGKPDEVMDYVTAQANMPLAIGRHPTLIGLLVRIALGTIAASSTERMLALGEHTTGLPELQARFADEAEQLEIGYYLRAERAVFHRLLEGINSGEYGASALGGGAGTGLKEKVNTWIVKSNIYHDWLFGLTMFEKMLTTKDQPFAARKQAFAEIENALKTDRFGHILTGLLLPAVAKCSDSSLRGCGQLRAVSVGIACERYRQKFGKWPATLADIPKDILPAIPNDPFTDKPINYKHLPDGVTVYTIGPDGVDDGGPIRDRQDYENHTKRDWGIKLYNPELRRKQAPPPEPGDVTLDPEPGLPDPDEPQP